MLGVGSVLWLLGACVHTRILGLDLPGETVEAVDRARFEVDDIAVDGPVMFVTGEQASGEVVPGLAERLPPRPTFACELDAEAADRLARLMGDEALGPIESCDIDLVWTREHGRDRGLAGQLSVAGSLAELADHWALDAEQLSPLMARQSAAPCDVDDPELAEVVEVAKRMSWWPLVPSAREKDGHVLAVLRPPPGTAGEASLVVRIGEESAGPVFAVPADLVLVLAGVRRDTTTLFPRFVFTAPLRLAGLRSPPADARLLPIPARAEVCLTTRDRSLRYRLDHWLLDNAVVAPAGVVADAFVWIMRCGPLGPLFTPEPPPRIGPIPRDDEHRGDFSVPEEGPRKRTDRQTNPPPRSVH